MVIHIDNHHDAKIYIPGSQISGFVELTPSKGVNPEDVTISLVGRTSVRRQGLAITLATQHSFLTIESTTSSPSLTLLQPGQTCQIPFSFTMPERLPSSSCTHHVDREDVRNFHYQMPPTIGNRGGRVPDDMAPEIAQVEYSVKACIRSSSTEAKKVITFLPNSPEQPPLHIAPENFEYCLSSSKKIRKLPFSAPQGRLTAFTSQPPAIHLDPTTYTPLPSCLSVHLALDSYSDELDLPETCTVAARLVSKTWFGERPVAGFPDQRPKQPTYLGIIHEAYCTSMSVYSASSFPVSWSSKSGLCGDDESLQQPIKGDSWTALLSIPLNINDASKLFTPTFYSCLVSRTYTIQLTLCVGKSKIVLAVPIQVALSCLPQDEIDALPRYEGPGLEPEVTKASFSSCTRLLRRQ